MYYINKKAFSMVEVIVVISIMIILSSVAITYFSNKDTSTNNTKITTDLKVLQTSFEKYFQDKQSYPMPEWNKKNYDKLWTYMHNYEDEETFWVSWFITDIVLPKTYVRETPVDPVTNQYYAYAKTKKDTWFQLSWVMIDASDVPKSVVVWNYSWEEWSYDLIKEYAWPNFVNNNSKEYFAYNPKEKQLVWKVGDYSWSVIISSPNWTSFSWGLILDIDISEGYKIQVSTWSELKIYFSDGSETYFWDITKETIVTLAEMKYKEDKSIFTSIKLALNMWTVFSKAPKLDENSTFEIYTQDAVAAVRWTIFWVSSNSNWSSEIVVIEWKVEAKKIPHTVNIEKIISNTGISVRIIPESIDNIPWTLSGSIIEVSSWENPKWINIFSTVANSSTWIIQNISNKIQIQVIEETVPLNDTFDTPIPDEVSITWWIIYDLSKMDKKVSNTLQTASKIRVEYNWNEYFFKDDFSKNQTISITWWTIFKSQDWISLTWWIIIENKLKLDFCNEKICAKWKQIKEWLTKETVRNAVVDTKYCNTPSNFNLVSYTIPTSWIPHNQTISSTWSKKVTNWTIIYSWSLKCNNWQISLVSSGLLIPNCDTWYTWSLSNDSCITDYDRKIRELSNRSVTLKGEAEYNTSWDLSMSWSNSSWYNLYLYLC